jgi:hypothetical protein
MYQAILDIKCVKILLDLMNEILQKPFIELK